MRRAPLFLVPLAMVSSAVLLAAPASAGPDLMVRFGYGSAGTASPVVYEPHLLLLGSPPKVYDGGEPYGGGLVFDGSFGFKIGSYVSVGVAGGIRRSSADSPDPSISSLERSSWNVGPYVRAYFPMVPIVSPWISVGARYVADSQSFLRPSSVAGVNEKWALQHHGVGAPLTVGVDYPILPMLFAGPSFEYMVVFPAGACAKVSADDPRYVGGGSFCADESEQKRMTTAKGYGQWSVGLQVRLTL